MKRLTIYSGMILMCLAVPPAEALTLLDCVTLAQKENPTLITARHQPLAAETLVTQARSGYLPTIDARAGYTQLAEPQAIITRTGSQRTQQGHYRSASLAAEQNLYDFGRTRNRVRSAEAVQLASKASVLGLEQDVLMLTIASYYRILEYQHQLATAQAQVASVTDHRRVVQALFDEGLVTRNDLLQAEVRLATSQQAVLEWEERITNAWLQLDRLIGKPADFRAELSEATLIEPGAAALTCTEDLHERPDLKSAQYQLDASSAEAAVARSQFLPQLYARGEANYVENATVREQTIYAATLGIRANLFDGFATTAARRRALENEAQSRDRLKELHQAAETEYRSALNDLEVASARIKTLEAAIAQAEENLRINRERYREQVGTATEVLDAQALLTGTQSDYHRAVYDRAIAEASVLKAVGKL